MAKNLTAKQEERELWRVIRAAAIQQLDATLDANKGDVLDRIRRGGALGVNIEIIDPEALKERKPKIEVVN